MESTSASGVSAVLNAHIGRYFTVSDLPNGAVHVAVPNGFIEKVVTELRTRGYVISTYDAANVVVIGRVGVPYKPSYVPSPAEKTAMKPYVPSYGNGAGKPVQQFSGAGWLTLKESRNIAQWRKVVDLLGGKKCSDLDFSVIRLSLKRL